MKRFVLILAALSVITSSVYAASGSLDENAQAFTGKKTWLADTINARGVLTGDITLRKTDSLYQSADAGAGNRNFALPAAAGNDALTYIIGNVGVANNLVIKSGVTTIATITPGQVGLIASNGSAWKAFVWAGSSTTGFMLADGSVTGATAGVQTFTNGISGNPVNKVTITAPATGSTLTIADGKTVTVNNTLTLAGTDGQTMTFPTTSATIARTDAAQTFTGHNVFEGVTPTGATGTGAMVFSISPSLTGTTTLNDATTPALSLATGKTNTGTITVLGKTSGSFVLSTADATAQALTVKPAAQTVGAATVTIPDMGGTSRTFVTAPSAGAVSITGPTAARIVTFPDAAFTAARTDAAQTFTGHNVFEGVTPTGATGTGNMVFSISPSVTGTLALADATTPALSLATGSTNTGTITVNGKTSGSLIISTADATAQALTVKPAAQTVGAATVTIPDMAGTSRTFVTAPSAGAVTIAGPTAARVVTFPDAAFTAARTDAANTFTGTQTFSTIESGGALAIGPSTATSITLGGSAIKTLIGGTFGDTPTAAQDLVTGNTITLPTTGYSKIITCAGGAATGIILTTGVYNGQEIMLINTDAASDATFATSATSNVADGVSSVLTHLTAMRLKWSTTTSRWYHVK